MNAVPSSFGPLSETGKRMHIVQVAYEATAFDVRLTRGGTATMVWELAREYTAAGHRVSVVTPAHGHVDYLRAHYEIEEIGPPDEHVVPLVLDPAIWPAFPAEVPLSVRTRAYRLRREGVDIYFLSDAYTDLLPDTLYPANEMQGTDLAYAKPIVFQVDAIRFIDRHFGTEPVVVQCYEPAYAYLLPPVMRGRPHRTTVSTVVVNTRIDDAVYRPQLDRLFGLYGAVADLDRYAVVEHDDPLSAAMRDYTRPSFLRRDPGADYVNYFAMVAATSDLVDFVSDGQRDHYSTFRDAPFERRFRQLPVGEVIQETAARHFVGWCALPGWWLDRDPRAVDRHKTLAGLGLDPARPTFYHAARLAPNHKGQVELFRAIDAVLHTDQEINFVVRCATGAAGGSAGAGDAYFAEVAARWPGNVHLDWRMADEEVLFEHSACADFCLFPSKFELDGFLITMAEAMACGAVPIATAQEVLSHYRHTLPVSHPDATGYAVPRSFRTDDRHLADRLADRIREAVDVLRNDPATYARLSANAVALARTFTWQRSAAVRLDHFARAQAGDGFPYPVERALEYGWFDRVLEHGSSDRADAEDRDRVLAAALERGDVPAYGRLAPISGPTAELLFDHAYARGDFVHCAQIGPLVDDARRQVLADRCRITETGAGVRVAYRLAHAQSVDLVVPAGFSAGTGSGNRFTLPLPQTETEFAAQLPPGLAYADLVFLVTLTSGRVVWDLVSGSVPCPASARPAAGAPPESSAAPPG